MDPSELLGALEQADRAGGRLVAIMHSHPDVGAYFSREDREMALGGGSEPLWPGVQYLVVSVRNGLVDDARLYTWEAARGDFSEEQLLEITRYS
jgi:proteasome lid subunit RPN8/RPN11